MNEEKLRGGIRFINKIPRNDLDKIVRPELMKFLQLHWDTLRYTQIRLQKSSSEFKKKYSVRYIFKIQMLYLSVEIHTTEFYYNCR